MNDRHKTTQTAFRIPEGLLAWLRGQAAWEGRTMTAILIDALEARRADYATSTPPPQVTPRN